MSVSTLLALAALGTSFEVEALPLAREQLSPAVFDLGRLLPAERSKGRDLVREMRALVALRFEAADADGRDLRCFGDLLRASLQLDGEARERWLDDLGRRAPELFAAWGADLRELLLDDHLRSKRWNPDRDDARDGMVLAEGWNLADEGQPPWSELRRAPVVEQAATVFRADLATIKEVENDYRHYPDNVGSDYLAIYPLEGSHYRGEGFDALSIYFRCDLPFPFFDYECELHILNEIGPGGGLVTHIYSTSRDFHWLAGRDVLLPVEASDGAWVAFLLVRQFGFDLDGVPDGPKHRRAALRGSLGNLKRKSESRFLELGVEPRVLAGVPPFRVLGTR